MNKNIFKFLIFIIIVSSAISGCGKAPREKQKIIATIDNEPIYVKDFNRAIALNLKRDPLFKITPKTLENQINFLIDKRLLIQEAKNKNLDQTDRFVDTIKAFWEQTLIRDLVAYKDREFDGKIQVSEREIRDFYDKLSQEEGTPSASFDEIKSNIKERIKNHKKRQLFDAWLNEVRKSADIKINRDSLKNLQSKYNRE